MKLVLIPAGEFLMGSPDRTRTPKTTRSRSTGCGSRGRSTWASTEVTQGQYRAVTGENPSHFKGSDDLPVEQRLLERRDRVLQQAERAGGAEAVLPVRRGCPIGRGGYRLPTEAEWEYACRAGSTTRYSFGDDAASLGEFAWYDGNSGSKTHPVGQKRPNAFGLYDMHGNVWEWCWDGYDLITTRRLLRPTRRAPTGPRSRVVRGGSWYSIPRDGAVGEPAPEHAGVRSTDLGFRVARVQSGR